MDRAWNERRLATEDRDMGGLHPLRLFAQQRLHLAALLIVVAASRLFAADIGFSPTTTQQEFRTFSRLVGQAIFADPVEPARSGGVLSFDVGVAATLVRVDPNASYWRNSTTHDFTTNGYVAVPRLIVSKGFGSGSVSLTYAK